MAYGKCWGKRSICKVITFQINRFVSSLKTNLQATSVLHIKYMALFLHLKYSQYVTTWIDFYRAKLSLKSMLNQHVCISIYKTGSVCVCERESVGSYWSTCWSLSRARHSSLTDRHGDTRHTASSSPSSGTGRAWVGSSYTRCPWNTPSSLYRWDKLHS